ncbi:MAG: hypothetical protein R2809_04205 [Flavobacteriales bacterium]
MYRNTVHILKTNLSREQDKLSISDVLNDHPEIHEWSVDLNDCDKVLRVVCNGVELDEIIQLLEKSGYTAEDLKD